MSTERRRDPDHSWDEFWGNMGLGSLLTRTIECPHGVEQCLGKTVGIAFSLPWDYFCTQPVFCITACKLTGTLRPTELRVLCQRAAADTNPEQHPEAQCRICLGRRESPRLGYYTDISKRGLRIFPVQLEFCYGLSEIKITTGMYYFSSFCWQEL